MPSVQKLAGGPPTDVLVLVNTDNETIGGNGSPEDPLRVTGGGGVVTVATDGTSIAGTGATGSPLHTVSGGTSVAVDGTTIAGDGKTGDALHTVAGGTAVAVDGTTITGDGTTGDPLSCVAGATFALPAVLAGQTMKAGNPVYLNGSSAFYCNGAASQSQATAIGILTANVANGAPIVGVFGGLVTLPTATWDIATGGSGGLTAGHYYYVAPNGVGDDRLSDGPPITTGQYVTRIGQAISATELLIPAIFGPIEVP